MSFYKKTIREYDLNGKTVLLRADYNVPLDAGKITDDYRIKQSLPTIQFLLEQNCKVIICSHLGRPKDQNDKSVSLAPVADRLSELLDKEVIFAPTIIGSEAKKAVGSMHNGQILLLENLRYHPEEEANDDKFAKQLADLAEVFVQDGFGVVHRAHASTSAITKYLPSLSGLLLEKEVDSITNVMDNPARPLVAIIGGAKIADKIEVLNRLIDIADMVAVGGAMANTFLLAEGHDIGKSMVDKDELALAEEIIKKAKEKSRNNNFVFYLPQDGVVADKVDKSVKTRIVDWSANLIAEIENYPKQPPKDSNKVKDNEMILDIGPFSASFISGSLQMAGSVIWNGTMGVTETRPVTGAIGPFAQGTELIIEAISGHFGHKPYSLVGGGDTVGYIASQGYNDRFDHVSTGGGASLELMAGKQLPGVESLMNKE